MTGVRFREDTGWEGRCDVCRAWLPLDPTAELWEPSSGYRRCAACRATWLRHKRLTGERLTEAQLMDVVRRERHRVYNRLVRETPPRSELPPERLAHIRSVERVRRANYRARLRALRAEVAA